MNTVFPQIDFAAKIQFVIYKIEICDNYSSMKNFPGNTISEKIWVQST